MIVRTPLPAPILAESKGFVAMERIASVLPSWRSPRAATSAGHGGDTLSGMRGVARARRPAADLNFEEAARLRDEIKRLRATE